MSATSNSVRIIWLNLLSNGNQQLCRDYWAFKSMSLKTYILGTKTIARKYQVSEEAVRAIARANSSLTVETQCGMGHSIHCNLLLQTTVRTRGDLFNLLSLNPARCPDCEAAYLRLFYPNEDRAKRDARAVLEKAMFAEPEAAVANQVKKNVWVVQVPEVKV